MPKDTNPPKWQSLFIISCFSLAFLCYASLLIFEGFNWLRLTTVLGCAVVLILWIRKQRREKGKGGVSEEL